MHGCSWGWWRMWSPYLWLAYVYFMPAVRFVRKKEWAKREHLDVECLPFFTSIPEVIKKSICLKYQYFKWQYLKRSAQRTRINTVLLIKFTSCLIYINSDRGQQPLCCPRQSPVFLAPGFGRITGLHLVLEAVNPLVLWRPDTHLPTTSLLELPCYLEGLQCLQR